MDDCGLGGPQGKECPAVEGGVESSGAGMRRFLTRRFPEVDIGTFLLYSWSAGETSLARPTSSSIGRMEVTSRRSMLASLVSGTINVPAISQIIGFFRR